MKKSDYFLKGLINAACVFAYVSGVAWLGFNSQIIFGKTASFLMPLFMLLLFVISASVTGLLVFGKPINMYLNGFKKEGLALLFATLAWLVFFLAAVVIVLLSI
ncbi:MAG: hypothetical protein HY433_00775 [Candidatus Liptonbacteria bacterium]|nr:hypothetical protein [Candidatus Liptonbacteria bacterium]